MKVVLLGLLLFFPYFASGFADGRVSEVEVPFFPEHQVLLYNLALNSGLHNNELPSERVLQLGLEGQTHLLKDGVIVKSNILTIIDFNLPSTQKRMWVIDTETGDVLFHNLVAHGQNSGSLFAEHFSNIPGSYTSSKGFYKTGGTYHGKHGLSLLLDGLEEGINDRARERAIVIHSANYVSESFIKQHGRLGRSHGCPALPNELNAEIINAIKGGSCLYIHAKEEDYLAMSRIFNEGI
jgi:hypothetical protein